VGASAFFFYAPIYDFRVENPAHFLDLPLFIIVATVTGQLAARMRSHALLASEREHAMRALYAFSKRLAVAVDPTQIYSAIQDHLTQITGCRVVYFAPGTASRSEGPIVPDAVQQAVAEFAQNGGCANVSVADDIGGSVWLIRPVSLTHPAFGLVAIDSGRAPARGHPSKQRMDTALADATATLERLDVARVIGEANLRGEAETLRAALIGSVSHGLRTPLASIMGSASILARAPMIAQEERLAGLVGIVREEAERLNSDIQRLLDASRISTQGVKPQMDWADAADIVNAAVASQHRRLAGHSIVLRLTDDLPLVYVDAVLIEQALIQLIDNAAKYSPDGATITIETGDRAGEISICVSDEGPGIPTQDGDQIFERFYRGAITRETTSGSGLGLWERRWRHRKLQQSKVREDEYGA
jgi:two-component system sensor histidine kinase KdpD